MDRPKPVAVTEVVYWVEDLDRSIAFYRDKLGFDVESIDPGRNAFLVSGDLYVALFNPKDPGSALGNEYIARTGGPKGDVYHVAFKYAKRSLDELARSLRESGEEVKGPIEFGSGRKSYFLDDPEGHYLELTDC